MQKDTTGQSAAARSRRPDQSRPGRQGSATRQGRAISRTPPRRSRRSVRKQRRAGGAGPGSQGSKTLTTEQRTTIRKTVLSGGNGPRATNVNFTVSVGTTVPTSVRVVAVPSTLIEIYPEWRGHMYFVVNDEIIIVDSNHRIIAVIPV